MASSERSVPVSMGSPSFRVIEGAGFLCTLARFPAGTTLPAHTHDRPTFAVILDGGFDLEFTSPAIRRSRLSCTAGTVFVEPAGERHANHVGRGGAEVIVFQPELVGTNAWEPFSTLLGQVQHFDHGDLALDARRLAREVRFEDEYSHLAAEALAQQMLVRAARRPAGLRRSNDRPGWLTRVDDFIHACFQQKLRIADIAEVAGVHPSHLADVFRQVYGMPLGTYVRRLRIEWCRDRLLGSDDTLSAIAYAAGFADQAHFTREFKRWVGATPARYRAERR